MDGPVVQLRAIDGKWVLEKVDHLLRGYTEHSCQVYFAKGCMARAMSLLGMFCVWRELCHCCKCFLCGTSYDTVGNESFLGIYC